eukprot:5920455-Amphidinium_carterae.1
MIEDWDMWEKAKAARKYLRSDAESSYREFDDEHKHWLAEHEACPRAPLRLRARGRTSKAASAW